jgi:hypothetical protein
MSWADRIAAPARGRIMAVGALLLALWAWQVTLTGPVARLRIAQVEHAGLALVAATPPPRLPELVSARDRLVAADEKDASRQLHAMLVKAANAQGLLIEEMTAQHARWIRTTSLRVVVSGDDAAVIRFIGAIEAGQPLARFADWRLNMSGTAGAVRFEGVVLALWSPAQ